MHRYQNLEIWNRAIDLTAVVYELSKEFPEDEKFGLTSQIKRAVISIASNIAEGAGRNSDKEFNQFLGYSMGSICEVETQLIIAEKLKYLDSKSIQIPLKRILELKKMTISLKNKMS
jgi:four helix bundle protein